MHVNLVTPWYPGRHSVYSGIFVQKSVEAVRSRGVIVDVEVPTIYPAPGGPIPENIHESMAFLGREDPEAVYDDQNGARWIPAPVPARSGQMGRARAFATAIELKRRILPPRGELTHAHLGVPTAWAAVRLGDSPLVITEHQSTLQEILRHPESRSAYREALEASSAFICVSSFLRDLLIEAFGSLARDKIEVIPNIVDLSDLPFLRKKTTKLSAWIYVGGLMPHKGIDALLASFAEYRTSYDPNATLTVVGDGPLRPTIERFSSQAGIAGSVTIAGPRSHDELTGFFEGADVLVHLSPFETFGIATLEAIGSGLPVVSLRNGGAESTWGDLERACGLLLDNDTPPEAIAESVAALRDDISRLDPQAGRAMVEERFAAENVASQIIDVYRRVIE